jgi:hypothetical protein
MVVMVKLSVTAAVDLAIMKGRAGKKPVARMRREKVCRGEAWR